MTDIEFLFRWSPGKAAQAHAHTQHTHTHTNSLTWLMSPCSTISRGVMGTSWVAALVVGVMTHCARRAFLARPSGKVLPQ